MGMYTWLSKDELKKFSKVTNADLNELFQEVRELMPDVYIQEISLVDYSWLGLKKRQNIVYYIYSACSSHDDQDSSIEVHVLNLKTSDLHYVFNYLCGLINGYRSHICKQINSTTV